MKAVLSACQKSSPIVVSKTGMNSPRDVSSHSYDDNVRQRSAVIIAVAESIAELSPARVAHDSCCVLEIMAFLDVDCSALSVHHMRWKAQLKLPQVTKSPVAGSSTSCFAKLLLPRAPQPRNFNSPGVFLRGSLTRGRGTATTRAYGSPQQSCLSAFNPR